MPRVRLMIRFAAVAAALSLSTPGFAANTRPTPAAIPQQPAIVVQNESDTASPARSELHASNPIHYNLFPEQPGFTLGKQAQIIPWGTIATISTEQATEKVNGFCVFRYLYVVRNNLFVTTPTTLSRAYSGSTSGPVLSSINTPPLAYQQTFNPSGDILLTPGTWTLYVKVDAADQILEFNETDNVKRVRVTVQGSCS